MKLLFVVFCCATLVASQTGYQCDLKAADWVNPNTCLRLDPNSTATFNLIDIRPCVGPPSAFCPATTVITGEAEIPCKVASTTKEIVTTGTVVPGMPCNSPADCISGNCVLGYCLGAGLGESCKTNGDLDCNPGFYCSANVCLPLLSAGAACIGTNQCAMIMGCISGQCTYFYSLELGMIDTECGKVGTDYAGFPLPVGSAPNYSVFCKSGTCIEGVCTFPLHSAANLPVTCTPGQQNQCATDNSGNYEPASITASTPCSTISYNSNGITYCALEIGDPQFIVFIQWISEVWMPLLATETQYCHTSLRGINISCLERLGGQYLVNCYTLVKENAENYAWYQGADVCTVQVFLPDYFSAQQYNAFCDTEFQCASNTTTFASNMGCIQQTPYSSFNIRPCADPVNTYCPPVQIYQANSEVVCQPGSGPSAPSTNLLPGDLCSSNYQCLSSLCEKGMCVGIHSGGLCPNDDSDCNPGLFCSPSTGKCAPLLAIGSLTACTRSSQCAMNAGCNFDPETGLGICTAYYSVAKDGSVSDCGLSSIIPGGGSTYVKYSAFCSSGTCALQSGTKAGIYAGTCVSFYKSQNSLPQSCNFGPTDCPMINADNALAYGKCSCGMSNTIDRYCSVDFGDQPWIDFFSWMQVYLSNSTTYYSGSCHTYRRGLDQLCMLKVGGVPRLMQYQEKWNLAYNYATIVNADNCTLQVYNSDYWTAYQYNHVFTPDDDNSGLWVGLAALLA